jgi:predicted RNA methylase
MLVLAPERVHAADIDNEAAAAGTREKGEALLEPAVAGVTRILQQMMAGEDIVQPPVTFRPEGRLHMVKGDAV